MAKEVRPKIYDEEKLVELAKKFGAIPKGYTKKDDIIAAGLLTDEEFGQLPYAPRSKPMESATQWPYIGGRKTYPLSGVLTVEETEMYYEYKKGKRSSSTGSSTGRSLTEEQQKVADSIRQFLKDNECPEELRLQFEALMPKKKPSLLKEMFNVDTPQELKGKVNIAYVMFRGPEGQFAEELEPNGADLFSKGFMPVFTIPQIRENLKKLSEKGIIMDGVIVDLPQ